MATFVFPADLLEPNKADAHFRPEADAARSLGADVFLIDHDQLVVGNTTEALHDVPANGEDFLYRGWMIPVAAYRRMESELSERSTRLRVSADAFAASHHLPNWYSAVQKFTATSVWGEGNDLTDLETLLAQLEPGAAVLKDFSKSEKQYWHDAMFIPDVSDVGHAKKVAARFLELRGDSFDGGFVLRQFERYSPRECRTWWVNGECVLRTAHPDTPGEQPEISIDELPKIEHQSPFFTADFVRLEPTGEPRLVELGDGQVSDRPVTTDPSELLQALLN